MIPIIPKQFRVNEINEMTASKITDYYAYCKKNSDIYQKAIFAKELYGCLVETDHERFRSRVQELADTYLDEVVAVVSKNGFIF